MYFPKFWAKGTWSGTVGGREVEQTAWGWSDGSHSDAERRAEDLARRAAHVDWTKAKQDYLYADRPLREEVLASLENAIISRNRYGAEVLNSSTLVFIDVDFPEDSSPGFFSRLFMKSQGASHETRLLDKLRNWQRLNSRYSFRVYRTAAGLRYIVLNQIDDGRVLQDLFSATDCDPRYRQLCAVQKSFRARLTPKPWRMGISSMNVTFPYENESDVTAMRSWVSVYNDIGQGYSTCKFLETLGADESSPASNLLIELHDQKTAAFTGRPLA